jgi:hypothetical protein
MRLNDFVAAYSGNPTIVRIYVGHEMVSYTSMEDVENKYLDCELHMVLFSKLDLKIYLADTVAEVDSVHFEYSLEMGA